MGNDTHSVRPTPADIERKLTTILSADVQGFSRLMGADEEATLRTLQAYRAVTDALIQHHRGRIVGTAGDSILAEFASVVDAVRCAVEIQHQLKTRNAELPEYRRMEFRIGINLGDVMVDGEQIYGDGVNIAARLQALADAGGIGISGSVYDQVKNKLALQYEDLGEQHVKNIAEAVRVWRIRLGAEAAATEEAGSPEFGVRSSESKVQGPKSKVESQKHRRKSTTRRTWVVVAVGGMVLLGGGIVTIRHLFLPTPSTQPPAPSTQLTPSPQPEPAPALPLPDKPSIVVLPFVNMSKDPEQEYFSDGLTETLTGDLSKISNLFVIARNSAFTYKGKAVKVQDVGREMGVRYVLEGSVLKAGDQVRITAQLIDATTGYHLWSEQYDRPLQDILTLHDEIVQKIVTTLRLQLTLQEQGYIVRKHTDNLEAYDAFLRGMVEYWGRFTKEGHAQARQMFEKAVALDSRYAEPYVWLGWTYLAEWINRWSADPQTLERALALAQQAITLDDSLPSAHSLLSVVYAQQQQYERAIAEGERAIALDPNNADSYAYHGEVLRFAGRPEDALRLLAQAMRLNPRPPPRYLFYLGLAYNQTGRHTEAVATLKEVISRSPNHLAAHLVLAHSSVQQWASQQSADAQTLEQALAAQRAIARNEAIPWGYATWGSVHLWQKQYELALAEMERAIALDPNNAISSALLAETLSRVGRPEEAVARAEQALRRKPFAVDVHLDSVGAAYYLAGRPEEAIAPLKQYLSRYPNILSAHLTLAAVYSELGREAEARAEAAEVLRLNPHFSLEVHKQRVPIKDPAMLERHLAALRKAGLK